MGADDGQGEREEYGCQEKIWDLKKIENEILGVEK